MFDAKYRGKSAVYIHDGKFGKYIGKIDGWILHPVDECYYALAFIENHYAPLKLSEENTAWVLVQ